MLLDLGFSVTRARAVAREHFGYWFGWGQFFPMLTNAAPRDGRGFRHVSGNGEAGARRASPNAGSQGRATFLAIVSRRGCSNIDRRRTASDGARILSTSDDKTLSLTSIADGSCRQSCNPWVRHRHGRQVRRCVCFRVDSAPHRVAPCGGYHAMHFCKPVCVQFGLQPRQVKNREVQLVGLEALW